MVQSCLKHQSSVQPFLSVFGAHLKRSGHFIFFKNQSYSESRAVSEENWGIHFQITVLPNQTPLRYVLPPVGEKSSAETFLKTYKWLANCFYIMSKGNSADALSNRVLFRYKLNFSGLPQKEKQKKTTENEEGEEQIFLMHELEKEDLNNIFETDSKDGSEERRSPGSFNWNKDLTGGQHDRTQEKDKRSTKGLKRLGKRFRLATPNSILTFL